MTYLKLFAAGLSLALVIPPVFSQDKSATLSKADSTAMTALAQADMAEIEAGKVATEKASSPDVKKFAEQMVKDHSMMLDEGKKLAQSKGATPPSTTDKKHQDALKKLQGLSGEDFDRQYMQQMVKDHQEALQLAEKTAKSAKDAGLKAHAEKGAPHIKEHLAMARKIDSSLSAAAGGTAKSSKK